MCNCKKTFNPAYTGYSPCNCNTVDIQPINTNCGTCEEEIGCINTDAKCVIYTGETVPCIGIESGDNFEDVLTKIGDILCITGIDPDYSNYNTACLGDITTQSQFVETISTLACNTNSTLNTFLSTTYPTFVTNTNNLIQSIRIPGTTGCNTVVFPNNATINQVLQVLSNGLCNVTTAINMASVSWSECFTAVTPPTNVYEGFEEVLRQICLVNSNIPTTTDTYKVKLTSTDTTEDYLANKFKSTPCITVSQVTDLGINKLQIGLGFTPTNFIFNPSQFDVTTGSNTGCVQNYNVSLSSLLSAVTCESLADIFLPAINTPGTVYGVSKDGDCSAFNMCDLRAGLFAGYATGIYNIAINTSAGTLCDAYTLIPATGGGSVSSVNLTMPSAFVVSGGPITTSGTLNVTGSGTTAQYIRGNGTLANFPTNVSTFTNDSNYITVSGARTAISVTTFGTTGPATYNNASGVINIPNYTSGGYTPSPCWDAGNTYEPLTTIIPSSGNNGGTLSYTFIEFNKQVSNLLTSRASVALPSYRWDAAGNLALLGNVHLRFTEGSGGMIDQEILIPFANVNDFWSNGCTIFNKFWNRYIGQFTMLVDSATIGFAEVYLCLNQTGTKTLDFLVKIKSSKPLTAQSLIIPLDGIIIPLEDNN